MHPKCQTKRVTVHTVVLVRAECVHFASLNAVATINNDIFSSFSLLRVHFYPRRTLPWVLIFCNLALGHLLMDLSWFNCFRILFDRAFGCINLGPIWKILGPQNSQIGKFMGLKFLRPDWRILGPYNSPSRRVLGPIDYLFIITRFICQICIMLDFQKGGF